MKRVCLLISFALLFVSCASAQKAPAAAEVDLTEPSQAETFMPYDIAVEVFQRMSSLEIMYRDDKGMLFYDRDSSRPDILHAILNINGIAVWDIWNAHYLVNTWRRLSPLPPATVIDWICTELSTGKYQWTPSKLLGNVYVAYCDDLINWPRKQAEEQERNRRAVEGVTF